MMPAPNTTQSAWRLRYAGAKGRNSRENLDVLVDVSYLLIKEPPFGVRCHEGLERGVGDAKILINLAAAKLYFEL